MTGFWSVAQRARDAGADEQRARQSRSLRVSDAVQIRELEVSLGQRFLHEGHDSPHVIARRQLRDDAAVGFVHGDLRMERMRQQPALGVVDRDPGLVAGSFQSEHAHGDDWVVV